MKKYIIPIFLASLLLLSACSPQLKESDFILTNEDLCGGAYIKYRELFHSYFTIKDYGGGYMEDGKFVYCLNEDSKQKENIDRFFELANAELEKASVQPHSDENSKIFLSGITGCIRPYQRRGGKGRIQIFLSGARCISKLSGDPNIPTYRNLIRRRC